MKKSKADKIAETAHNYVHQLSARQRSWFITLFPANRQQSQHFQPLYAHNNWRCDYDSALFAGNFRQAYSRWLATVSKKMR